MSSLFFDFEVFEFLRVLNLLRSFVEFIPLDRRVKQDRNDCRNGPAYRPRNQDARRSERGTRENFGKRDP